MKRCSNLHIIKDRQDQLAEGLSYTPKTMAEMNRFGAGGGAEW